MKLDHQMFSLNGAHLEARFERTTMLIGLTQICHGLLAFGCFI